MRRGQVVEKNNKIVQTHTKLIWCQSHVCEERGADGTTVTRRIFTFGEQIGGTARFMTSDHLGSITEVTDATSTLLARYAFDPWGRRTLSNGNDATLSGYTGHQLQPIAGLWLTQFRGYDAELGRWVSEDPYKGEAVGLVDPFIDGFVLSPSDEAACAGGSRLVVCCRDGRADCINT